MKKLQTIWVGILLLSAVLCTSFSLSVATFAQSAPTSGVIVRSANLRAGPGTTYAIVGAVKPGQEVTIAAQNAAGDWYQLSTGEWIAAFLVKANPTRVAAPSTPAGTPAQVTQIVDGDTIDVTIDNLAYRVRYILMDTPERGAPFYEEATAANRTLVLGQTVYLVKDVNETDRYGRLLRYVYLADGTLVNAELVRQGYAVLATFPPDVAKEAEIRAAQQEAVAASRGLWADASTTAVPTGVTAMRAGNLRGGPGTSYPVVGSVQAGQALNLIAQNGAGDWFKLADGQWIAASLVNQAPTGLAIDGANDYPAGTTGRTANSDTRICTTNSNTGAKRYG